MEDYWQILTSCNWLAVLWFGKIVLSLLMIITLQQFKNYTPVWYNNVMLYGKHFNEDMKLCEKHSNIFIILLIRILSFRISKSCFGQFYVAGLVYACVLMLILVSSYATHSSPKYFVLFLDVVAGANRHAYGMDPTAIVVALTLMLFQVTRRAYECYRVSVFSPKSKVNILHYMLGMLFYLNIMTSIMAEAPGFNKLGFEHISFKRQQSWRWYQPLAIGLYFWAAWHQHRCIVILASLRKNSKGDATSSEYKIPTGDWFNFLSSPHYSTEILIYFSLNILTHFNHSLLLLAFIFVLLNQFITAQDAHFYYINHFKNYPKTRKILIPGIF